MFGSIIAARGIPDIPRPLAPTTFNASNAPPKAAPMHAPINGLPRGKVTP